MMWAGTDVGTGDVRGGKARRQSRRASTKSKKLEALVSDRVKVTSCYFKYVLVASLRVYVRRK
jgi:hypothetical protein